MKFVYVDETGDKGQSDVLHDRPSFLVGHLIGNRASFLCTKAPVLRVPDELLDGMGSGLPRGHWSKEASSLGCGIP